MDIYAKYCCAKSDLKKKNANTVFKKSFIERNTVMNVSSVVTRQNELI